MTPRLTHDRATTARSVIDHDCFGHRIWLIQSGRFAGHYQADGRYLYSTSYDTVLRDLRRACQPAICAARPLGERPLGELLEDQQRSQILGQLREQRTADDLLRAPEIRSLVYQAARSDRFLKELNRYARPQVQYEAITRIKKRLQRRSDRETAQRARTGDPGRTARILEARRAEREQKRIDRHRNKIRRLIAPLLNTHYRISTRGDHTLSLSLGDPARATGESSKGDRYSRSCTWRRTDSHHDVTVPRRWQQRVYDRGLAVVGGHVLLDAAKVRGRAGQYDVTYVCQGRGFAIESRHARILVDSDLPAPGEDDRTQIRFAIVVAHSGMGTVIRDTDCRVVQVVVYDSTTGERHHLTVPPRFGRDRQRGESEHERVRSAIAWTFGLSPEQYDESICAS